MSEDLSELLRLLKSHDVEFIVVGAHAVSAYVRPRFTEDLDIWVNRNLENSHALARALREFGFHISDEDAERLLTGRHMIRLGAAPNRVDILGFLGPGEGFSFSEIRERAIDRTLMGVDVPIPAKTDLIEMKRAAGRPKDLRDLNDLNSG